MRKCGDRKTISLLIKLATEKRDNKLSHELRANCVRGVSDFSSDPMKAKIAEAKKAKVHPALRDSSLADATWKLDKLACACTPAARKARSRRGKWWWKFWRASKSERRSGRSAGQCSALHLLFPQSPEAAGSADHVMQIRLCGVRHIRPVQQVGAVLQRATLPVHPQLICARRVEA